MADPSHTFPAAAHNLQIIYYYCRGETFEAYLQFVGAQSDINNNNINSELKRYKMASKFVMYFYRECLFEYPDNVQAILQ